MTILPSMVQKKIVISTKLNSASTAKVQRSCYQSQIDDDFVAERLV